MQLIINHNFYSPQRGLYLVLLSLLIVVGCRKDEEIAILNPDAGPSFLDVENDGYYVRMNATPVRAGQGGVWHINSGENGRFEDINNPKSFFYGEPGELYELEWEISEGNQSKASNTTVSFKALSPEIITTISGTIQNNISVELKAVDPKFGAIGRWEIRSGNGGRFLDNQVSETTFIGLESEAYTLDWILQYGSKEVSASLQFTTDELKAMAGTDELDIKTPKEDSIKYYTLGAILPPGASGTWRIINNANGIIHNVDNPNALFQGIADVVYTLTWEVTIDTYTSVDTVDLRFRGKWGVWEDARDEQRYRFTEINGLEWMADNYNYAIEPGVNSWYYGHGYRSVIQNGEPLETDEDRKKYGRIYSYFVASDFPPDGWRLPTAAEVESLIKSLGGPLYAKEKLVIGGETGLELNYPGYYELSSSSDPAFRNVFKDQELAGYFFTQDYNPNNGYGIVINFLNGGDQIYSAILPFNYFMMSVRYVREVQN